MTYSTKTYRIAFLLVTLLFFLWGFSNHLNGILIPHLRKALQLTNFQSTLVDTAVYFAYFLMALPAGGIIQKLGYQKGIVVGLLIFSAGAFLFIPAADYRAFPIFLIGLFIIGCGLTVLETAANPYAAQLGNASSATQRLNLAQSFNGLAAFVGPLIGARFILSGEVLDPHLPETAQLIQEAQAVKGPYVGLAIGLVILAVVFWIFPFPEVGNSEKRRAESTNQSLPKHVWWAVVAQFFYVGAQVCVSSFFIRLAMVAGEVDERTAGYYLGVYGLLFMVGRFVGTGLFKWIKAHHLLSAYAVMCILLSLMAIFSSGIYIMIALGGLGFFMSIMFPTIFSLGIEGLGDASRKASSWLVMAIIGGALFPLIMGGLIDLLDDHVQAGFWVPLICYAVVLFVGSTWKKNSLS